VNLLAVLIVSSAIAIGCAAQQATRTSDSLFSSPAADLAREHAPDLFDQAQLAWAEADDAERHEDHHAAADRRTEARLWLAAGVAEAERVQLDRRRAELQREEERWANQLARDQKASAVVARDISRHEASAIALREAERLSALSDGSPVSDATLDAVLTRVRLNLALAKALGAADARLLPLRERADAMAHKPNQSAKAAEALLLKSEALIGEMRAQWPEPAPGASTELVETALVTGFGADRVGRGVIIRSERFFTSSGDLSGATVKRFHGLLAGFPHGPVACQVAVPELRSRVWARRVALLVERLRRMDDPGRVSTAMVVTQSLPAGAVQCTFGAYRGP
jgi:PAS domain-containing protein